MSETHTLFMESPFGEICIQGTQNVVTSLQFCKNKKRTKEHELLTESEKTFLLDARSQLFEYFEGQRKSFDINYSPHGTDFERSVWNHLAEVPYGKTASYSDIARSMGDPSLTRAIARALSVNPILIIVPCHRIIGKDGSLTGYAGGIDVKRSLLELEGSISLQYSLL